jgi:hypothetical protein
MPIDTGSKHIEEKRLDRRLIRRHFGRPSDEVVERAVNTALFMDYPRRDNHLIYLSRNLERPTRPIYRKTTR